MRLSFGTTTAVLAASLLAVPVVGAQAAPIHGRNAAARVTTSASCKPAATAAQRARARRLKARRRLAMSGWSAGLVKTASHTRRASCSTTSVAVADSFKRAPSRTKRIASSTTTPTATATTKLEVGIDGGKGGWSAGEIAQRTAFGASVTRHEFDPAQPVNAQDAIVLSAARDIRTRIHALLGGNTIGDPIAYRDYVVAFIKRYGQGGTFWAEHPTLDSARYAIRTFELGNEPYYGAMTREQYADAIRPALETVAAQHLPAVMLPASYNYGDQKTDVPWVGLMWMETLYSRIPNLNSLIGGFATHPYWYGHAPDETSTDAERPFTRLDLLRQEMNDHGAQDKPIYVTEYGQSTSTSSDSVTEARQASDLHAMLTAAASGFHNWNIAGLYIYQLNDRGTGSSDRELQFGLLRQDGTPKPAYATVKSFLTQP